MVDERTTGDGAQVRVGGGVNRPRLLRGKACPRLLRGYAGEWKGARGASLLTKAARAVHTPARFSVLRSKAVTPAHTALYCIGFEAELRR